MPVKIYDVTRELTEGVVVYPGDIPPHFHQEDRGAYLLTAISISSHSGTHLDAPAHYLKNDQTVDRIPFDILIGPARVLDCTDAGAFIEPRHLAGHLTGPRTLLFKTRFSKIGRFEADYPALSPNAARLLTDAGITCVGIDAPSIETYGGDGSVHIRLLGCGTVILELLDLTDVPEGDYFMVALPLRLKDADGSPVRVILCERQTGRRI
jgi:arylformamidase